MSESLVGGSYNNLSTAGQELVNAVMGDTVGGQVTTTQVGSGTLVVGTGAGGDAQGVFISQGGTVVTGEINTGGGVSLTVALPPEVSLAFQGPSAPVTAAEARAYLTNLVNQAVASGSPEAQNLNTAINSVIESLGGLGNEPVSLRFVAFTTSGTGARAGEEVVFNGGGNAGSELLVFALSQISDKILTLSNVKAAMLVGNGTVKINDFISSIVTGDAGNQAIIGGAGRDTLVGGGGSDTLTGGSGADVFGISVLGNLTITDFNIASGDKLAFTLPGVTNLDTLAPLFTGMSTTGGNTVLQFGSAGSVTLVGVNPADLTVDLIKFSLT